MFIFSLHFWSLSPQQRLCAVPCAVGPLAHLAGTAPRVEARALFVTSHPFKGSSEIPTWAQGELKVWGQGLLMSFGSWTLLTCLAFPSPFFCCI